MEIYPQNNAGNFFVKLPQTIELNTNYEVGLVEIQFPNTYFNVLDGDIWIRYEPPIDADNKTPIYMELSPGLYKIADNFIDDLNKLILEKIPQAKMRFFYKREENKAVFKVVEEGATVTLSDSLRSILAFPASSVTEGFVALQSDEQINLESQTRNVYAYCNLVSPRVVGDVLVPLLRTVPILDRTTTSVFRIYDKPHYVPLSRFSFDTIEILLANDKGTSLPFTFGTSVLTLHFRTRKHLDLE